MNNRGQSREGGGAGWVACLKDLLVYSPTLFSNQHATGWVTRKMASLQRQQMASVSAVEEWVGGPYPK